MANKVSDRTSRVSASLATKSTTRPRRTVYFSFCHPEINPGGAQTIAKRLHDEHLRRHGADSSLFIAANIGGGPKRAAGTNLLQLERSEFLYITERFDYIYFTNHDYRGQLELIDLIESFAPTHLHFHHFMGFGMDFVQAVLKRLETATSIFTVHEHMLVCHNDGHLLQRSNSRICATSHPGRCATCMPEYRYDYFQHRLDHFQGVISRFDLVTAVSEFTANAISASIKTRRPIAVIPNGPFRVLPRARQISTSNLHVAYIGQIHRTKGVHILLKGIIDLVKRTPGYAPRLKATIWGSFVLPEYQQEIECLIDQLLTHGVNAKLGGTYDSSNLRNILSDANVVVVPSLWPESYCITADEAIAMEKILICSDFPAARERFNESESIRFVPPGSEVAISTAMEDLLDACSVAYSPTARFDFADQSDIFNRYETASEIVHA